MRESRGLSMMISRLSGNGTDMDMGVCVCIYVHIMLFTEHVMATAKYVYPLYPTQYLKSGPENRDNTIPDRIQSHA